MKIKSTLFLILTSLFISACTSGPFVRDVRFDNVSYDPIKRKTIVSAINFKDQQKVVELTSAIMKLGPSIDRREANFVAREAVFFSQHLANEYKLVAPANSQNVLVNRGKRDKGLCYHFARDMTDQIVAGRTFNTLSLNRAVSFQGHRLEHNVLTVAAKGKGIADAIILDAWRDSATLYWVKTGDDPMYAWSEYTPRTYTVKSKKVSSGG